VDPLLDNAVVQCVNSVEVAPSEHHSTTTHLAVLAKMKWSYQHKQQQNTNNNITMTDMMLIKPTNESIKDVIIAYYNNKGGVHKGDSGLDLYALTEIQVPPHTTAMIRFGIACQANTSFWLLPRSSISKTPLRMSNSIGLIDKGYRGEVMASVDNISDQPYTIKPGDKIFQLAFPDLRPFTAKVVSDLEETSRGTGGFGSTNHS
jgi:dUTP pyrophosphatase